MVVSCLAEVSIGNAVLAGPRVFIGDAYHDYHDADTAIVDQPMSQPRPIAIGDGAFLGVHCAVLPGVTIGERAYIGANAVVTHDVPANAVVAGNPGRVIRRWDAPSQQWISNEPTTTRERSEDSAGAEALRTQLKLLRAQLMSVDHDRLVQANDLSEREAALRETFVTEQDAFAERQRELAAELESERGQRADAEFCLAELQSSLSWRVTAPLRAAKRGVARRRG